MRTVIAALVVVALIAGILAFWPRDSDVEASATTTSTTLPVTTTSRPTTTSVEAASTVTTGDGHVVTSVEEAEEILRDLWFGWFEGIYLEDEDRIREVVILEETVATARESFGTIENPPSAAEIEFSDVEILESNRDCLAVWTSMTLSGFRTGETQGVNVLRWHNDDWAILSVWKNRDDLWIDDCDALLS